MDIEAKCECVQRSRRLFLGKDGLTIKEIVFKSLMVLADQGLFTATNFITGIIIARICGKESLGFYALGWSILLLTVELQSSLILSPYTVFGHRLSYREHMLYAGSTMIQQILLGMLSVVLIISLTFILSLSGASQELVHTVWALALVVVFILFRSYARQVCLARIHVNSAFLIDLSVALIQFSGLLFLAHTKNLSVSSAF